MLFLTLYISRSEPYHNKLIKEEKNKKREKTKIEKAKNKSRKDEKTKKRKDEKTQNKKTKKMRRCPPGHKPRAGRGGRLEPLSRARLTRGHRHS